MNTTMYSILYEDISINRHYSRSRFSVKNISMSTCPTHRSWCRSKTGSTYDSISHTSNAWLLWRYSCLITYKKQKHSKKSYSRTRKYILKQIMCKLYIQ